MARRLFLFPTTVALEHDSSSANPPRPLASPRNRLGNTGTSVRLSHALESTHATCARLPLPGSASPDTGLSIKTPDATFSIESPPIATRKHDHQKKLARATRPARSRTFLARALARPPAHALPSRNRRCLCARARSSRTRASPSSRLSAAAPSRSAPTGTLASDAPQCEPLLRRALPPTHPRTGRHPAWERLRPQLKSSTSANATATSESLTARSKPAQPERSSEARAPREKAPTCVCVAGCMCTTV